MLLQYFWQVVVGERKTISQSGDGMHTEEFRSVLEDDSEVRLRVNIF